MTRAELRRICRGLNNESGTGGQTALARLVGWDGSTLRRKLSGRVKITRADELAIRHVVECRAGVPAALVREIVDENQRASEGVV